MSTSKKSATDVIKPLSLAESEKRAIEVGLPGQSELQSTLSDVDLPKNQLSALNVFRVFLHHPTLAKALADTLMMLLGNGNVLDPRLRELIIMRLGWQTGSNYEWTQHWKVALVFGCTEDELVGLRSDWQQVKTFDGADQAVLQATDDMLEHGRVLPETLHLIKEHIGGEDQMLEVVAAICNWRTFSQMLLTFEVELEEGVDSWPPDGLIPHNAP
ncbi:MAG: carboxymuconolactone decarboxylase family protein [Pseudomonadales bacterium]|nr:carboxymuconolactone decarboxylase family protein [Pseudomonadales bacterium]